MALPVTIPNTFANATASIPLSQLDTNFNTLANAVNGISDGSETLANASVTVLTAGTVDINGGAIDGTTVGTSNAAAGSFTTLNTSGQVVFNDAGADVDFRVEGDTDANLLFVDASADRVGVGTNTPFAKLQVVAASADYFNPQVMIGEASNSTGKQLHFGYNTTANTGYIQAVHNGTGYKDLLLQPNGGNVGIGVTPSAWSTANNYSALQLRNSSLYFRSAAAELYINNNTVYNGTNWVYAATAAAARYDLEGPAHKWYTAPSGTAGNAISWTQAMTLDANGNLLVGTTSGSPRLYVQGYSGGRTMAILQNGGGDLIYTPTSGVSVTGGESATDASLYVTKASSTSRSINAAGTVNQSGADYAEYMFKAGDFVIAKGDVCGINADGKVTNVFADAISFCVKSTNPGLVGGDTWGNEDAIGKQPEQPVKQAAEVDEEGNEIQAAETDEDFAARQAQYEADLAEFEAKLEAERQKVDRIAFSGQVPVNVIGATAGQYIVPVENNGGITGIAINEADMTLAQYMNAVGKVIAIEEDGRARIIVKVA